MARSLLYGEDYHAAKLEIMAIIERVGSLVDERTANTAKRLVLQGRELAIIGASLGLGALVVIGVLLLLVLRRGNSAAAGASAASAGSAASLPHLIAGGLVQSWPLLLSVVLVGVLISGVAWRNMLQLVDGERTDLGNSLSTVLQSTAKAVDYWFYQREQEAHVWAQMHELREAIDALTWFSAPCSPSRAGC